MNLEFLKQTIINQMRMQDEDLDTAARKTCDGLGITDRTQVDQVVAELRERAREFQMLEVPPGVHSPEYDGLSSEAQSQQWYIGSVQGDVHWPAFRHRLEDEGADYIDSLDFSSRAVVSHLANPHNGGLKKKGLVVGHVQSGKTANYTAVIAKAADAGYRIFIVMSGLHNNLRRQTQTRLEEDLVDQGWGLLTTDDEDFGSVIGGEALARKRVPLVAVVKKNASRLRRLRDWLLDIDELTRRRCPVLIIDDEADQATPNSASIREERTTINRLVREIWDATITGSYVGYTATPFANVFMDPADSGELYPSNFIIEIPRSAGYFGAERIFGKDELDDSEHADDGLDMVRVVSEEEAASLRPPSKSAQRATFDPELPESLKEAVRWFLVATAIRRARGQRKHSSMLIHTTHYTQPHFTMRDRVRAFVSTLHPYDSDLESLFREETSRAEAVATVAMPPWQRVQDELSGVLEDARVVVDNGTSTDRLSYDRLDGEGNPMVETTIAIGGATLSRGLTLEGLVVSYFVRSSNTYDTLLQMGRWFGYRPGYEDLPRIWMPEDLAEDFRFLALIEDEIRGDIRGMERAGMTPEQVGVRVRAHPGRLEITQKMGVARPVRLSYAGDRRQTFILQESNGAVLRDNISATKNLIRGIGREHFVHVGSKGVQWLATDVAATRIEDFARAYAFHPDQPSLRSDLVAGWIKKVAPAVNWNVAVMGPKGSRTGGGQRESVDLGLGSPVPLVNRAPLKTPSSGTANIKALLSRSDWVADLDADEVRPLVEGGLDVADARWKLTDRGLLLVYAIDPESEPLAVSKDSRRSMKASGVVIGLGFVFPQVALGEDSFDGTYYSVHPDWTTVPDDLEMPVDSEDSREVRVEDILGVL